MKLHQRHMRTHVHLLKAVPERERGRSNASHSLIGAHSGRCLQRELLLFWSLKLNWTVLLASLLHITWLLIHPPSTWSSVRSLLSLSLGSWWQPLFIAQLWQLWKESIMLGSPNPQRPRVKIKRVTAHTHLYSSSRWSFTLNHQAGQFPFCCFPVGRWISLLFSFCCQLCWLNA